MLILRTLMVTVEVLCGLILVGLVLIQKSKGGGLGVAIGGGMGENLFGARTGNVLTKMTVLFGVVFMANTLFLAMIYSGAHEESLMSREAVATAPLPPPSPGRTPTGPPTLPASPGGAPTLPGADLGSEPVNTKPIPIEVEPVDPEAEAPASADAETAAP